MLKKEVEAILEGGRVIVTSREDVDLLNQGGYGTALEEKKALALFPHEALYLLGEKRMRIIDPQTKEAVSFSVLLEKLRTIDPEAWTKYLFYRDLRSRGYVVREGFGVGIDFRVYERGEYGEQAAKYFVFGVREGAPVPIEKLTKALHFVQGMKRELILAVIDRRGEIVYYSTSRLTL